VLKACAYLFKKAKTEDREHITIFYGKDATQEMVDQVVEYIKHEYPDHEVEIHEGGQPHYQFIISVE
jgi:dihydroxyacetone kinase-like predicted kinase